MNLTRIGIDAIERGLVWDGLTRLMMRRLCQQRLRDQQTDSQIGTKLIQEMSQGEIAKLPDSANQQHYEVPAEFFEHVLGANLKYSSCYFENENTTLEEAEAAALSITCQHAELADGQQILELGCGWGSLSMWMASHFPNSNITAVSNSNSQRQFIEATCRKRGISNLKVITRDMNLFTTDETFDRVVSVEMFEHMRNYQQLLQNIGNWLVDDGKLFVHIFCHSDYCYPFETEGETNWMGRHFFTGGMMPSANIFEHFDDAMKVESHNTWNGKHYQRTLEAWLENMDRQRDRLMPVMEATYGSSDAKRWFHRWRMFMMACAELFGYRDGKEWFVSHYLLRKATEKSH